MPYVSSMYPQGRKISMGTASAGIVLWARNASDSDEEDKPDERSVRIINLKVFKVRCCDA